MLDALHARARVDVLRLLVLFAHGGVYADVDMEPLRSLDPLLVDPRRGAAGGRARGGAGAAPAAAAFAGREDASLVSNALVGAACCARGFARFALANAPRWAATVTSAAGRHHAHDAVGPSFFSRGRA